MSPPSRVSTEPAKAQSRHYGNKGRGKSKWFIEINELKDRSKPKQPRQSKRRMAPTRVHSKTLPSFYQTIPKPSQSGEEGGSNPNQTHPLHSDQEQGQTRTRRIQATTNITPRPPPEPPPNRNDRTQSTTNITPRPSPEPPPTNDALLESLLHLAFDPQETDKTQVPPQFQLSPTDTPYDQWQPKIMDSVELREQQLQHHFAAELEEDKPEQHV
jgi:hypothetical protein